MMMMNPVTHLDQVRAPVPKRSFDEFADSTNSFFYASSANAFLNDFSVEETDFDFFGSSDPSSPHQSDSDQEPFAADSPKDSPVEPISIPSMSSDPNIVLGSPQMDKLAPSSSAPVKPTVFQAVSAEPSVAPAAPTAASPLPDLPTLPASMRGQEVAVTAPLREGALGIRCGVDDYGVDSDCGEIGENGVRTVWYCDRPFPRFDAQLFEKRSGRSVEPLDSNGNPWTFQIGILDGFGNDASDKVYGHITTRDFPVGADGVASVAGIRFSSVSSKAGGSFQIVLSLKSPTDAAALVTAWKSDPIQVLSYRLFHSPKVAFENLRSEDPISKMKGIGALYAKRFAAIGVRKVSDLAQINLADNSPSGVERVHIILSALRKDRGAMTMAKLDEYIAQARAIIDRNAANANGRNVSKQEYDNSTHSSQASSSSPKRRRTV